MTSQTVPQLLRHYRDSDADEVGARLTRLGATPDDVRGAVSFDPEVASAALRMNELTSDTLDVEELLRVSVLAEERVAALRHEAAIATRARHTAIRLAAKKTSIVDLSRQLGISRQAVSQIVNAPERPSVAADAFTRLTRLIKGSK